MQKKLSKSFLVIVICVTLLVSILTIPVQAQSPTLTQTQILTLTPNPTPIPTLSPNLGFTPTSVAMQFTDPNVVTFAQLQQGDMKDIVLNGPYDQGGFGFAIPADWALKAGTQLNLLVGVSFNSDVQNQANVTVVGGGTFTVSLNNVLLATLSLNKLGEVETRIDIPLAAFEAARSDGGHVLWFGLESSESCRFFGQNTMVFIHPTSYLALPHDIVQPSTSLVNFPRPIIQDSFTPDTALFIVPDQPSSAELQAAFITAAGLGKLSSNKMILNMTTLNNFKNEDAVNNHLIFVGKAASLPLFAELTLPLPVIGGQFQLSSDGPDDGVVEMVDSPWSSGPYVSLIVSGNTDQGIIKAAQAISTGVLRPNSAENFAVIEQVNSISASSPQAMDRTLADLGYSGRTFENRGYNSETYTFNIPLGMTVSPDAYFEMIYGHSSLMDYASSQIVLILNDQPIGSVRMSDATASLPTNQVKIMIPPSAIRPGDNYLRVSVNMVPIEDCSPPDVRGLWVNIWSQSILHLPLIAISVDPFAPQDLAAYPAPFNYNPELGNTAFVLEHNDLESWRSVLQISAYLGWQSSGQLIALSTFYGDEIPVEERPKYNLLIIGRASRMPIMSEMNDNLPAPFLTGSDTASESNNFQVTYRIPPDSPMGYIETMQSPWNPNNVVLAILGNTTQGVNWAAKVLIDPILRSRLGGNFAEVYDRQIFTADTLYSVTTTGEVDTVELPGAVDAPLGVSPIQVTASRPEWILPVLALLVGLIALNVLIVAIRGRSFNNPRGNVSGSKRIVGSREDPKE